MKTQIVFDPVSGKHQEFTPVREPRKKPSREQRKRRLEAVRADFYAMLEAPTDNNDSETEVNR
jgi:hypothetical protein